MPVSMILVFKMIYPGCISPKIVTLTYFFQNVLLFYPEIKVKESPLTNHSLDLSTLKYFL